MPADATPAWIHVPELPAPGATLTLSPEDAHYVTRVCRAREGDTLHATDGRGSLAGLRLVRTRPAAEARVETLDHAADRSPVRLVCGAPEGERADWLIEKLAELGVARFQPLDCARASWSRIGARQERWDRLALAALRQSMRRHRLEILPPISLDALVEEPIPEPLRWLADAAGSPPPPRAEIRVARVGVVGPSPGFTHAEGDALRGAGFEPIALSGHRLRTETAGLALAAAWSIGEPGEGLRAGIASPPASGA